MNKHIVYRIYYGDQIVYVGRTNQPLQTRIRGHLFAKPMHRILNIDLISKVEFHEFDSEADMNLYEIYYILLLHPVFNVDDKTKDYPTVQLPAVEFTTATFKKWDIWKEEIRQKEIDGKTKSMRRRELMEKLHIIRSLWHTGEMSEEEYYDRRDAMSAELDQLNKDLSGW